MIFNRTRYINIGLILIIYLSITASCLADTVYFKNGQKIIGHIEQEESNFIWIVTTTGRFKITKDKIKNIEYLDEAQDYLYLAKESLQKKEFKKAISFYNKALGRNPELKEARSGLKAAEEALKAYNDYLKKVKTERIKKLESLRNKVKEKLGLVIKSEGANFLITEVITQSISDLSGLKKNDKIEQINGKSLKDLEGKDVLNLLLSENKNLTIYLLRNMVLNTEEITYKSKKIRGIGVFLIRNDGRIIIDEVIKKSPADLVGIKAKDTLLSIEGEKANYLSLREIADLTKQKSRVEVEIGRKIKLKK